MGPAKCVTGPWQPVPWVVRWGGGAPLSSRGPGGLGAALLRRSLHMPCSAAPCLRPLSPGLLV